MGAALDEEVDIGCPLAIPRAGISMDILSARLLRRGSAAAADAAAARASDPPPAADWALPLLARAPHAELATEGRSS